jgi:hypothetical protein
MLLFVVVSFSQSAQWLPLAVTAMARAKAK